MIHTDLYIIVYYKVKPPFPAFFRQKKYVKIGMAERIAVTPKNCINAVFQRQCSGLPCWQILGGSVGDHKQHISLLNCNIISGLYWKYCDAPKNCLNRVIGKNSKSPAYFQILLYICLNVYTNHPRKNYNGSTARWINSISSKKCENCPFSHEYLKQISSVILMRYFLFLMNDSWITYDLFEPPTSFTFSHDFPHM